LALAIGAILIAILAVALLAPGSEPVVTAPVSRLSNGPIVYTEWSTSGAWKRETGRTWIRVLPPDGGEPADLIPTQEWHLFDCPSTSADRRVVAFFDTTTTNGGTTSVLRMARVGEGGSVVVEDAVFQTGHDEYSSTCAWLSPDGTRAAFATGVTEGKPVSTAVHVIEGAPGEPVLVMLPPSVRTASDGFGRLTISWSSDQSHLAVADEAGVIHLVDTETWLVREPPIGFGWNVVWSPTEPKLAWSGPSSELGRDVLDGPLDIFVADADGSAQVDLTARLPGAASYGTSAWAAAGTRIAFVGGEGDHDLYVTTLGGPVTKILSSTELCETGCALGPPTWSPDGKEILISADTMLARITVDGSLPPRIVARDVILGINGYVWLSMP
jgi:hypothetical protein